MNDPILMKGSKYGVTIWFDPDYSYEELLLAAEMKFKAAKHFFNHSKIVAEFDGRVFTSEEEVHMVKTIEDSGEIYIACLVDRDKDTQEVHKRLLEEESQTKNTQDGMFCRGTLRGKQTLESEKSIVIIGDVDEDATVISKGHVVVTGSIYGTVIAGVTGDCNAVIAAQYMRPKKLKIGDIIRKPVIGGSYSWAKL